MFHSPIDVVYEDVGGVETNGPSEKPESSDHSQCVPKVEKSGNEVHYIELHIYGGGEGEGRREKGGRGEGEGRKGDIKVISL